VQALSGTYKLKIIKVLLVSSFYFYYIKSMKIKIEECEGKVNEVNEKMNELKKWIDKNWEEIDEEGKEYWMNYCADMVESLNFYL